MKLKTLNLKKQSKEAWKYLNESMFYINAVIIIFILSVIFGFIFRENLTFINEILRGLIEQAIGLNTAEMIFFILQNNLQGALSATIFGIAAGIPPMVSTILNGTVLGYVLAESIRTLGHTTWLYLLPHGIFELPAIFISFGLGIKLGFFVFEKDPKKELKKRFYNSLNTLFFIVLPLLIIAAVIEGVLIGFVK